MSLQRGNLSSPSPASDQAPAEYPRYTYQGQHHLNATLNLGDSTEHPPGRSADGAKPGGQADPSDGCAPIQQGLVWRRGLTQTPRSSTKGNAKSCSSTGWGQLARKQLCGQGAGILADELSTSQHRAPAAPMTDIRLGCCRKSQGRPSFQTVRCSKGCFVLNL